MKHLHWVPEFYLRYFATPETRSAERPQVWIFSKDASDGDESPTNIRNVCGKRYLYAPLEQDGSRNWELEDQLEKLEATLGHVWKDLAEGFVHLDDSAMRKGVSLFVAVMHLRNPETRRVVETIHQKLVAFLANMPSRPDGTPALDHVEIGERRFPVEVEGWHEFRSWGKNDHDKLFVDIVRSEAIWIAEMLMKKRWSIVCAETDTFVTSDKPVAIQHLSRDVAGFGTPDGIVTFPLGPRRLLVMDDMHDEPENQYYPLHQSNAGAFNLGIWRNGSRFMITGRPVEEVLTEICAWANEYESGDE
ncbi:MAG: DUF4238 domain-containing protein [Rhodocyclales bacterium]|nr:DUF4238 domain-containing protein [Rhodocyclales bacterium]